MFRVHFYCWLISHIVLGIQFYTFSKYILPHVPFPPNINFLTHLSLEPISSAYNDIFISDSVHSPRFWVTEIPPTSTVILAP